MKILTVGWIEKMIEWLIVCSFQVRFISKRSQCSATQRIYTNSMHNVAWKCGAMTFSHAKTLSLMVAAIKTNRLRAWQMTKKKIHLSGWYSGCLAVRSTDWIAHMINLIWNIGVEPTGSLFGKNKHCCLTFTVNDKSTFGCTAVPGSYLCQHLK